MMSADIESPPSFYTTSSTNPNTLVCLSECIFLDPSTTQTHEFVFTLRDEIHVNGPGLHRKELPPASTLVKNNIAPLIQASQGVGKIFVMFIPHGTGTPQWAEATAFYVASNVICTAAHATHKATYTVRFIFFSPLWLVDTLHLESVLVESSFPVDGSRPPTNDEIKTLGEQGFWVATPFPAPSVDTQRVAFETEVVPSSVPGSSKVETWDYRHDFQFLRVERHSQIYFIPKKDIGLGSAVLIAYAGLLDAEDLEKKYQGAPRAPSAYRLKSIFGSFDRRFISPGEILEYNAFFASHRANAESCSSGAPVLLLSDGFMDPFVFSGVHVGAFAGADRNFMLHTMHKAFMLEWATHVLPLLSTTLPALPVRRQQLTQYIQAVLGLLPADDKGPIVTLGNKLLSQMSHM